MFTIWLIALINTAWEVEFLAYYKKNSNNQVFLVKIESILDSFIVELDYARGNDGKSCLCSPRLF